MEGRQWSACSADPWPLDNEQLHQHKGICWAVIRHKWTRPVGHRTAGSLPAPIAKKKTSAAGARRLRPYYSNL
jgi:hypothetical protein